MASSKTQAAEGPAASERFQQLFSSKVEDFVGLTKYVSVSTGLTVYIADVDGPTVNGYICLATEAHDDDGLPHTLEHLIFLGSEDFPYKGVLDLLANRCLASGTNAWTATDHTCYTVMTAGSEGFLNFLPVYLEHILYPTLTDSGFLTEVHHINGDGEDAGVVYSEMQGVENTGENLVCTALMKEMYPGKCGYKSETGGALRNLRESTTNEKVRNYHKAFYQPRNVSIIITGQVVAEDVFRVLEPVEDKILSKGHLERFVKPWQSPVPPLTSSVEKVVQFPNDDVNYGLISVAWRGPKSSELFDLVALDVLLLYLSDTAISPLQQEFIEIECPYCSKVACDIMEYSEGYIEFTFENVPSPKLPDVKKKLFEVLTSLANTDAIDMQRMASVIHRKRLAILSRLESKPHNYIAELVIPDVLYGMGNDKLEERLSKGKLLNKMTSLDEAFWKELLKRYFLDSFSITVIGEPSRSLMEKMCSDEKDRIGKQQQVLGSGGLTEKREQLDKAIAMNNVPPPAELLSSYKIPGVDSLKFHPILRHVNYPDGSVKECSLFPICNLPFRVQLDDVHSNFVMLHAVLDTSSVRRELKLYLPLFLEALLESPVMRNGVLVPHDTVVKELAEDTVTSAATVGVMQKKNVFSCGSFAQMVHFILQVEIAKYAHGVRLLNELLFNTRFTKERLKVIATKMINGASKMKRDGHFLTLKLANEISFHSESNHHICNLMRQLTFLNDVCHKLDLDPQTVIDDIENLRSGLTDCSKLTFHIAADVNRLIQVVGDPAEAWRNYFSAISTDPATKSCGLRVQHCCELLMPFTENSVSAAITGVGSVESAFLYQYVPCSLSQTHPDLPPLMVLLQYLTQLEGPMWKQIRGLGLAYGYDINVDPVKGLIVLFLYRATNLVGAYKQALSILQNHLNSDDIWETSLLETARSSLIFNLVESQETVKSVSHLSLLMHLDSLDDDYHKNLLRSVSEVKLDEVKRVCSVYVPALLDSQKSRLAVCCNPGKVKEISAGFREFSRDLTVTNLEDGFLAKICQEFS